MLRERKLANVHFEMVSSEAMVGHDTDQSHPSRIVSSITGLLKGEVEMVRMYNWTFLGVLEIEIGCRGRVVRCSSVE